MKNELFILIQIQKNIETCYYNQRLMKIFIFLQTLLMINYTRIMPETVLVGWLMSMPLVGIFYWADICFMKKFRKTSKTRKTLHYFLKSVIDKAKRCARYYQPLAINK